MKAEVGFPDFGSNARRRECFGVVGVGRHAVGVVRRIRPERLGDGRRWRRGGRRGSGRRRAGVAVRWGCGGRKRWRSRWGGGRRAWAARADGRWSGRRLLMAARRRGSGRAASGGERGQQRGDEKNSRRRGERPLADVDVRIYHGASSENSASATRLARVGAASTFRWNRTAAPCAFRSSHRNRPSAATRRDSAANPQ